MSVKEHYDRHLAHFYEWMAGDFKQGVEEQKRFFTSLHVEPCGSALAIDLGCGHGLQSVALAEMGFTVRAVDFCTPLLARLSERSGNLPIALHEEDVVRFMRNLAEKAELIVCMGDTIAHLEHWQAVNRLFKDAFRSLSAGGRFIVSFRDYSHERSGVERFIPVKSDENRILTCFLEFGSDKVRVTDLLQERHGGQWEQRVSSYGKLRTHPHGICKMLVDNGFHIHLEESRKGMVHVVAERSR